MMESQVFEEEAQSKFQDVFLDWEKIKKKQMILQLKT